MIPDGTIASGVISKIINDLAEVSKSKIKKAVEDKKNKHKSLESQLYNLIISLLKEMDDNLYDKNSDKIYDMAEKLLIGFIEYGREDEDAVRYALKNILPCVDYDKCMEFKKLLIYEISKEEYDEIYHEIRLLQEEKEYRKTDRIEQKVDNLDRKLDNISKNDERIIINSSKAVKFQNNKKQDYIDNWNSRLFLHIDNDERPLTLADAFIIPDYNYHLNDKKIKFSDQDTLDEVIEKFINCCRSSNMLITGAPGTGKTSIVSWIAHEYKENADIIILRFRDWEKDELSNGLLKCICNTLNCINGDLENKILILDGFDEIKSLDNCNDLLNDLFNDVLDFKNIKIIITSRTYYIRSYLFQSVFELLPFQIDKIEEFYFTITDSNLSGNINNLDVLGIPVILYMAIMSDIDITKEATKPELYSKIFAVKGGVFDKFTYSGIGYDYGNQPLRDVKNIQKYLRFLQEIAIKMFDENNLSISRKENEIPKLVFQGAKISILEFPIKYLFDNTISNFEFVHKSIYEYFVSEYIIQQIKNVIYSDNFKEKLAAFFGKTLINGKLSFEIIEFLKYKIRKSSLITEFDKVNGVFQVMLQDGKTYYTKNIYKNVIDCELRIFVNMLEIVHLWEKDFFYINEAICDYIKYNYKNALNLSRVDLRQADLRQADLRQADLREANLREANLEDANLRGADLSQAKLKGAKLIGATFNEDQVQYLRTEYDLKNTKVFINETKKVLTYENYCKKIPLILD